MNQVVIILVLYNEKISHTPSYSVLKQAVKEMTHIHVFFYDNSLHAQTDDLFSFERVTYIHNPENPGLATAYTAAEQYLLAHEADLLLLLDQDTTVPKKYIEQLLTLEVKSEVGAYVPIIQSRKQQLSPVFVDKKEQKTKGVPLAGVYTERIMAINSGTVIPKQVLQKMGPFNPAFPLDFLDHWFFWWLYQEKKKIVVLNYHLEHELSVSNYQTLSETRYESILSSETRFYTTYDAHQRTAYQNHLLFRTAKQFLVVKNRNFWRRTLNEYRALMKGK